MVLVSLVNYAAPKMTGNSVSIFLLSRNPYLYVNKPTRQEVHHIGNIFLLNIQIF